MRFDPEIMILAHNEDRGLYVIEIPAGVRNPYRADLPYELSESRYALVADNDPSSTTGPLPYVLNLFEQNTQVEDEDY